MDILCGHPVRKVRIAARDLDSILLVRAPDRQRAVLKGDICDILKIGRIAARSGQLNIPDLVDGIKLIIRILDTDRKRLSVDIHLISLRAVEHGIKASRYLGRHKAFGCRLDWIHIDLDDRCRIAQGGCDAGKSRISFELIRDPVCCRL